MRRESALDSLRRFVRERERGLVVAWLASIVVVLGAGLVAARGGFIDRAVDAWDARVLREIDAGAQLVAAKRWTEASLFLERLDAKFPARGVKHRFDRERERILTLLTQSYTEEGRKRRALETAAALVAFDPRNWQNHFASATAALAFNEPDLARTALDGVLAIHPSHLPSVEARIALEVDAGQFARVPTLWRAYQEAYRLATLEFSLGGVAVAFEVPADAQRHRFELPFALAAAAADGKSAALFRGEGALATRGWSIDLLEIGFREPRRIGIEGQPPAFVASSGPWTATSATIVGEGQFSAQNSASRLTRIFEAPASERVSIDVVVYKACTPSLWRMVETSYRNELLWDELERERARTRVGGCLEAGSLGGD